MKNIVKRIICVALSLLSILCCSCSLADKSYLDDGMGNRKALEDLFVSEHYNLNEEMTYFFLYEYVDLVMAQNEQYFTYYGGAVDLDKSLKDQTITGETTWFDYCVQGLPAYVENILILAEGAIASGYSLSREETRIINEWCEKQDLADYCNKVSVDTLKKCKQILTLAEKFNDHIYKTSLVTDDEYIAEFEENKKKYTTVNYRYYSIDYKPEDDSDKWVSSVEPTHYAVIDIKDYGKITVALDENTAPITVANFISLANDGFYNGLKFHRIIENFMMQGGAPADENNAPATIKGEFKENDVENYLSHVRGAISMARSNNKDSASSQFFIVHKDTTRLDGKYAAFGYVIGGMDVVDRVCEDAEPTDNDGSIPADAQPVINSVTVYEAEGYTPETDAVTEEITVETDDVTDTETEKEDPAEDEENVLSQESAKEFASALRECKSEKEFVDTLKQKLAYYYPEFTEEEINEKVEKTLVEGEAYKNGYDIMEWFFSSDRKAYDIYYDNSSDAGYYVVCMLTQPMTENNDRTVNVRHILLTSKVHDSDEDAKIKADELLKQFNDSGKDLDLFSTLALEFSEDEGSYLFGGLYQNLEEGATVTEFNDWCFDEARKIGDTTVVKTSYGYHVMYFEGEGYSVSRAAVVDALKKEKASAKYEVFVGEHEITSDKENLKLLNA